MLDIMSRKTKFNLFTVPKWFACDYEHECLSVYSTALRPKSAGIGSRSPMTLMRTRDLWTMRSLGCCGSSMTTMGSTLRSDFKKCQEKPTQKSWILLRVNRRHYKRWQVCTGSYLAWVWLWLLNSEHSQIHSSRVRTSSQRLFSPGIDASNYPRLCSGWVMLKGWMVVYLVLWSGSQNARSVDDVHVMSCWWSLYQPIWSELLFFHNRQALTIRTTTSTVSPTTGANIMPWQR